MTTQTNMNKKCPRCKITKSLDDYHYSRHSYNNRQSYCKVCNNIIIKVKIFNRWGQLLYSNSNYKNDWDGRSTITNEYVPHGTYFYIAEFINKITGEKTIKKGPVVVRIS